MNKTNKTMRKVLVHLVLIATVELAICVHEKWSAAAGEWWPPDQPVAELLPVHNGLTQKSGRFFMPTRPDAGDPALERPNHSLALVSSQSWDLSLAGKKGAGMHPIRATKQRRNKLARKDVLVELLVAGVLEVAVWLIKQWAR